MGQINGIVLPDDLSSSLGGSPEDAAKAFLKAASQGMAQVIVDALSDAVGSQTVGAPVAPDWTKLIKGCNFTLTWETPPGTPVQMGTTFATTDSALGGFSGSCSGTFTF